MFEKNQLVFSSFVTFVGLIHNFACVCSLELYEDLDRSPDLGIENYGVSMTTLNEVFLKMEGKSVIEESGK